ncbi:MAG: beta-L-arabinofuranosidase domain-containing protein [Thermoguttaceae bacterium]
MNGTTRRIFVGFTAAVLLAPLATLRAAETKVPLQARLFDLQQIRLLDGPFKEAQERDRKYLYDLDADRLLHNFRVAAGLPSAAAPLGGWEAPQCELRGHFVGHYLSACALMYASTDDERLKAKADYIVAELAKCQAALSAKGYNNGFLSAYPESFFDRVDAAKSVWAPYYTLHKIMAGLFDMHQHAGNQQALDVLVKMADWLKFRVGRLSHDRQQKALSNEHGGMNEILANLYGVTGNPDHLKLARAFNHEVIFDPLARGEDQLNGKHANTQVPKIIGAAREYELTGEAQFAAIAANFWKYVAIDRAYCIGGHSDNEHFFPVTDFARHLGPATAETCNTYNMLKLTQHLFAWQPSAKLMDFYERALYNQILASQDPRTGMMYYFASLKPGHFKNYNTPNDSFWCCTGTGIENHAKYADTIYAHDANTLYVNLFIPSELTWKEKGLVIRQETKYPESDTTRLTFKCAKPVKLTVKVRRPFWTQNPGYAEYNRQWQDGDTLDVQLPMNLRVEPLPGEPKIVALFYGPIALAGELGTEGLDKLNLCTRGQLDLARVPVPEVPVFVCDPADLLKHIERVPRQPLTFRTSGIGRPRDVTLSPYWRLHHQRFTIYWSCFTEAEWQAKQAAHAAFTQGKQSE